MSLLKAGINRGVIVRILSKIPLVAGLSNEEYEDLAEVCSVSRHQAGTVLFHEDDSGYHMYVVLSGAVVIETKTAGVLGYLGAGEIFGEIAVLRPLRRTATARFGEDTVLLSLTRDDLDLLLARRPRISYLIMRNVAATLAERLVVANEKLGGKGPWEVG